MQVCDRQYGKEVLHAAQLVSVERDLMDPRVARCGQAVLHLAVLSLEFEFRLATTVLGEQMPEIRAPFTLVPGLHLERFELRHPAC